MNARILNILAPARAIALSANCKTQPQSCCKPSMRTYYLGSNSRVSQRKQLVGEIVATVRACSTDHARYLFTNALAHIQVQAEIILRKPFIGPAKHEPIPRCWVQAAQSIMDEPALNDRNPLCVYDRANYRVAEAVR